MKPTNDDNNELFSLWLDGDNLRFLRPTKGTKFSKSDALLSLIEKSEKEPVTVTVFGHIADMANPMHAASILALILSNYPGGSDALAKDLAAVYACHGHKSNGQSKTKTELWLDFIATYFNEIDACDEFAQFTSNVINYDKSTNQINKINNQTTDT